MNKPYNKKVNLTRMYLQALKIRSAFFILILLNSSNCALHLPAGDDVRFGLQNCVQNIIKKMFLNDPTLNFVFEDKEDTLMQTRINNPRVLILIDKPLRLTLTYHNNYVIYTKNYTSLDNTMRKLQSYPIWNESSSPRGCFLVVTPSQNNLPNIFKTLFDFDIINAVVVLYNTSECTAYSWNVFAESCECGKNPQPYRISNYSKDLTVAYSSHVKNLNGCTIKLVNSFKFVRSFRQSPFSTILVKLVEILSNLLNATLCDIITEDQKHFLYDKQEGISFGIIYYRLRHFIEQYDLSDLVYEDQPVWAVPKPQQITNLQLILSVFKETVWGVIVTVFITIPLTWWISAKYSYHRSNFQHFSKCFFAVLSFSVGRSVNLKSITNSAKCIALSYLFYSIVIGTSFQANLISDLTHPTYEHGINTLEELWKSSLYLVVHETSRQASKSHYKDDVYQTIVNRLLIEKNLNLTRFLGKVAFDRNSATPIIKRALRVFVKESLLISTVESISLGHTELSAIMRKGHYFMPIFNKYVKRLVESGFHEKIISDAEGQRCPSRKEKLNVVLTLKHLLSAFALLSIGLACALLTFLSEMYYYYYYYIIKH